MNSKKFKPSKLNDKNGKILAGKSNRWYIEYYPFDEEKNRLIRKRLYQINNIESAAARYDFARKSIAKIDQLLKEGYQIKTNKERYIFEVLDEMLLVKKNVLKLRSYQSYKSSIKLYKSCMENKILTNVKVLDFFYFRDFLLKKRKKITTNSYVGHIRNLLTEAKNRGYIDENPFKNIAKLPQEISFQNLAITKNDQKKILLEVKKNANLWLYVRLMYYCFLRNNEIRQLKICHFDMDKQQIFIPSTISKNGKSQFVTIPNAFKLELIEEFNGRNRNEFILSKNGGASCYGRNTIPEWHRLILKKLGFFGVYTAYSWKHTGVVEAYKNGVDIKSLQLQCRHHCISVTDVYLKSMGLYLNKAILQNMPSL